MRAGITALQIGRGQSRMGARTLTHIHAHARWNDKYPCYVRICHDDMWQELKIHEPPGQSLRKLQHT